MIAGYITDNGLVICNKISEEDSSILYGKGKIAFTPDDWKKTPSSEVICHCFAADISKIVNKELYTNLFHNL